MKKIFVLLIRLYQLCLRPFVGQCCRFAPSCSEYAVEAFETHGTFKGMWLTTKRLLKCGPWHRGGYDPVPENSKRKGAKTQRKLPNTLSVKPED